ncbi:MAG TPA: class I SAM-dependent methyltransferase [Solirubrobacteraceae bacterium]|nr:class I SAM-dependent methyltransferase [Solirubrobacteraceae bacterium]
MHLRQSTSLAVWNAMKEYYDTRAPEYDEWYLGLGRFTERDRPGWLGAVEQLKQAIAALPPAKTLDVACGTGFLTRHIRGSVTGLDQSAQMIEIASKRIPEAAFVEADAIPLPFDDSSFDRVFTGHFYGHLDSAERAAFVAEAHRVAPELIVVDSAVRPDHDREEIQERILNDGSAFEVYKRYFDGAELADELGGGTIVHESQWFVMVATGPTL